MNIGDTIIIFYETMVFTKFKSTTSYRT